MAFRVGIDIGSTATKACVLSGEEIVYTLVIPTGYSSVDASARVLEDLELHGYPQSQCCYVATGYGRVAVPFAEKTITEITCHGRGAAYLFGPDCVVVDIGGQDTKSIVLKNGKVTDFRMNDKCSAGTGKFLEIMANRLGLSQEELTDLALNGKPTSISSMCTVFAESEVISLIGSGTPREDICWGIVESIVKKVAPLVPQSQNGEYVLTGGLCENEYIVGRLTKQLGGEVKTCSLARYAGALGAALSLPLDCVPAVTEDKNNNSQDSESASPDNNGEQQSPLGEGDKTQKAKDSQESRQSQDDMVAIFSFKTTTDSLAFEKMCRNHSFPDRLIPLPDKVSAGCGYAWRAPVEMKEIIASVATEEGCAYQDLTLIAE